MSAYILRETRISLYRAFQWTGDKHQQEKSPAWFFKIMKDIDEVKFVGEGTDKFHMQLNNHGEWYMRVYPGNYIVLDPDSDYPIDVYDAETFDKKFLRIEEPMNRLLGRGEE